MDIPQLEEIKELKIKISDLNIRNKKLEYCLKTAIDEIRTRDRALAHNSILISKITQNITDHRGQPFNSRGQTYNIRAIAPLSNNVVDILMNYNGIMKEDQENKVDLLPLVSDNNAVFPVRTIDNSLANTSFEVIDKPIKIEKSEDGFVMNDHELFKDYPDLKNAIDPNKFMDHKSLDNFRCKICYRTMFSRQSFIKHLLVHTGEGRFKCEQCEYRALDRSRLIRHMRKHTGERPFPCDLCDYKATQSSSLARHRRQHTGERPYQCDLCDYRASQGTTLNTHRLKHARDHIFYCDRCDYKTVLEKNMEQHKFLHMAVLDCPSTSENL